MSDNAQHLNPTLPDLSADLARLHIVITRGLRVVDETGRMYQAHGYPEAELKTGFFLYARSLFSVLHSHHLGEDEIAFPQLQPFMPDAPFTELRQDHQQISHLLDQIQPYLENSALEKQPGPALQGLLQTLAQIAQYWHPHIRLEESQLSSARLAQILAPDVQGRLSGMLAQHGMQHARPDYLVVPFLLFNLPPGERAILSGRLPEVVTKQLLPGPWKEYWAPMQPFLLE